MKQQIQQKIFLSISIALTSALFCGCSSISSNSSWMGDNQSKLQNKNITDIRIPGSHKSNSFGIKYDSPQICNGEVNSVPPSRNAIIAELVRKNHSLTNNQLIDYYNIEDKNIYSQLKSGIRYLDLQICLQNNTFYTSNYFLTDPLSSILHDINNFSNSHSDEIIIVDLDNKIWDDNGIISEKNIANLHQEIINDLGNKLIKKTAVENLTFAKLWKGYGRVILMSSNQDLITYNEIWDRKQLLKVDTEATWTTIKKLTNIQLSIDEIESNHKAGMSIIPIYASFNPQKNTVQEIGNDFNNHLIMDYLYSLPESTPLNIIVGDKEFDEDLVKFSTYMYMQK